MKAIFITLLILTNSGTVSSLKFEIFSSCHGWFDQHVATEENKRYNIFTKQSYFIFDNQKVVGYICSDS